MTNVATYITKAIDNATVYVKSYCEKYGVAIFIACGGDDTLSDEKSKSAVYDQLFY